MEKSLTDLVLTPTHEGIDQEKQWITLRIGEIGEEKLKQEEERLIEGKLEEEE